MPPTTSSPYAPARRIRILPFLHELLEDASKQNVICWTNETNKQFKILNRQKMAELWGAAKSKRKSIMTYDTMSRALRVLCAEHKKLERIGDRGTDEYRFLEGSGNNTEVTVSDGSTDVQNVLGTIQQTVSSVVDPNPTESVSKVSTENRGSTFFNVGKVGQRDFKSKSSRLMNILHTLTERVRDPANL